MCVYEQVLHSCESDNVAMVGFHFSGIHMLSGFKIKSSPVAKPSCSFTAFLKMIFLSSDEPGVYKVAMLYYAKLYMPLTTKFCIKWTKLVQFVCLGSLSLPCQDKILMLTLNEIACLNLNSTMLPDNFSLHNLQMSHSLSERIFFQPNY